MFYQSKYLFREHKNVSGHINVLGGLHIARGSDVTKVFYKSYICVYIVVKIRLLSQIDLGRLKTNRQTYN